MGGGSFVRVGDVLGELLERLKPPDDAALDAILAVWPEAAGELVAQQARPERYERGVLYANVSNHLWLQELRRGIGQQIEQKLRTMVKVPIRAIRWQSAAKA
ncbi:MAG: DUF721 domain-containing protein [bacterium]|nr:DUF721 domain-containing protein [bacterium]